MKNILAHLTAQPELFASYSACSSPWTKAAAIADSGYIQPLDFFGDGPRIPLIVVSPYATGGARQRTLTPTTFRF